MRKSLKTIAAASALILGLTTASALYAQDALGGATGGAPGGPMGGPGAMMGGNAGGMMGPGMMGSGMMGMMGQMGQMGRMAQNCNEIMASQGIAPNGQWNYGPQPLPPEGQQQGE